MLPTLSLRPGSSGNTFESEPQPSTQLSLGGGGGTHVSWNYRCYTLSTWTLRAEYGEGEADLLGSEVGDPRAWEKKKNDEPERTTACETLGIPVLHLQDGNTIEPPSGSSVEN